jgi:hypothetical protein
VNDVTDSHSLVLFLLIGILESSVVSDAHLIALHRYIALANNKDGTGPLASYFKGEVLHGHDTDIFTSNMCRSLHQAPFTNSLMFGRRSCRRCMLPCCRMMLCTEIVSTSSVSFVLSS